MRNFKNKPTAVCIIGPTGSGKSALALNLASHFDLEIISVDSAQIYRGLDVGTAKPSSEEQRLVKHHLIDIIDPTEHYSAAEFCRDATRQIIEISSQGKLPLLVGGTMLYFKSLRDGISNLPDRDETIRAELERDALEIGWPKVHEKLSRVDPQSASRINPNDSQRIQRALEVFRLTGRSLTELFEEHIDAERPFDLIDIALIPNDRSKLHKSIQNRFEKMLEMGFVEEVRKLRETWPLNKQLPAMRSVGYRQSWEFLDGEIDEKELLAKGVAATRQLAKRQITWLRKLEPNNIIDPFSHHLAGITKEIIEKLKPTEWNA
ncbi:MAG: tRNA (adenosine(37)-N6)-dimethylallyltransferase MiaA [Betaproteobacteria bacterium]